MDFQVQIVLICSIVAIIGFILHTKWQKQRDIVLTQEKAEKWRERQRIVREQQAEENRKIYLEKQTEIEEERKQKKIQAKEKKQQSKTSKRSPETKSLLNFVSRGGHGYKPSGSMRKVRRNG
eukprot:TRINITY_DN780123_c0_g1_i1.p1 TRINITY_DN780123_c0_g1~~TRINITY_DN780123_c0_g1_i1.p1  ORF type:complete len:122 (+),score=27.41 TRINITY_DN780123_c0_g1_i1:124-489(+)